MSISHLRTEGLVWLIIFFFFFERERERSFNFIIFTIDDCFLSLDQYTNINFDIGEDQIIDLLESYSTTH